MIRLAESGKTQIHVHKYIIILCVVSKEEYDRYTHAWFQLNALSGRSRTSTIEIFGMEGMEIAVGMKDRLSALKEVGI